MQTEVKGNTSFSQVRFIGAKWRSDLLAVFPHTLNKSVLILSCEYQKVCAFHHLHWRTSGTEGVKKKKKKKSVRLHTVLYLL